MNSGILAKIDISKSIPAQVAALARECQRRTGLVPNAITVHESIATEFFKAGLDYSIRARVCIQPGEIWIGQVG